MENRETLNRANAELRKLLFLEEEFWKQNVGMTYFSDGDRNTKFFHAYVNGRRRKLTIDDIHTEEGDIINTGENIDAEAMRYFADQFKENSINEDYENLNTIPQTITESENLEVIEIPSKEEVKKIVYALKGDSSGGLRVSLVLSINTVGT